MKVSQKWLQKYFEKQLPDAHTIDEAFTFHAFEIEEHNGDLIDLDVLPNRSADCLCHRGVAKELGALLDMPVKNDPLRSALPTFPTTNTLNVTIEDSKKCQRYNGVLIRSVKVGPSPKWLKEALESVGQRSINNIVDATNYVMLDVGQPLHAFDAHKLVQKDGGYSISVRDAREGEHITTLSGDEYTLPKGTLLIADGNSDTPLGIAGIKGGIVAEVGEKTTDIIVEAASFDGALIRRTAQRLKLITDASLRFQNRPSSELVAYGARDVVQLIIAIAGGEVESAVDVYPDVPSVTDVSVTLAQINDTLGSNFSHEEVTDVFRRLALTTRVEVDTFTITPPFERTDLVLGEDLIEIVVNVLGYDKITKAHLPAFSSIENSAHYKGIQKVKDFLVERGFTEISTQSFAKKGDVVLANPFDKTHPALRTSLTKNMQEAMAHAKQYAARVLPPGEKVKLFEIGNTFTKDGERLVVETSEPVDGLPDIVDDAEYKPQLYKLSEYHPFSVYPFMLRDISVWVPADTQSSSVEDIIRKAAGELLVRICQFDSFEKDGRVSYAFRMVFESPKHTLTDGEINIIMEKINSALATKNEYEVR